MGNGLSVCGNIDIAENNKNSQRSSKNKQSKKLQQKQQNDSPPPSLRIEEHKPIKKKRHIKTTQNKPKQLYNLDITKTRSRSISYCPLPTERKKPKQCPLEEKGEGANKIKQHDITPNNIALFNSQKHLPPTNCESPRPKKTPKENGNCNKHFKKEFGRYLSSLKINPGVMDKTVGTTENDGNESISCENKTFQK